MVTAPENIDGYRLRLRLVTPDDAQYIHGLRTNPIYNQHLSPVVGTAVDQRAWLERYKDREAKGQEFYYLAERLDDNTPCGLIRLYELTDSSFTWGSFLMDSNKPPKGALECAVLSFEVGFERLDLQNASISVRASNERAINFYHRFGMIKASVDARDCYFKLSRESFRSDRPLHISNVKR